jgi:CRP/FNR family cyclic AMP-dependent transcriptional regulator
VVTSTSSRRSNVVSAATAGLRGDNSRAGDERARGNLPPRELILSAKDLIIAKDSFSVLAARQVYVMAKRPRSFDTKSFLARVGDGQSVGKYRKGQIVFSQGDAGDAVFYIQKGKAKLTVVSEQGKEAVIAILGTDEFFGEACLAGQVQRIATVTTMTDSVIARLEKSAIIQVIHQEPKFSEMFIAHLLGRAIRVEADLVDQLFNSSEKRLARMLLLLANFGKEGAPEPVIAKISQETLAEMIGTTRSRVSFFMNKFRKLGFIEYNGGIEVHSSLLNVVLHDQPQIKN